VNTLLAGLTFTPALNYNANFTIATSVSDGVAPALIGTKGVTGTPVNDAPVFGNNSFAVNNGSTLVLTSGNLSATDVDDVAASLVFTVSGIANGQFELVGFPGVPITGFTQGQLAAGQVQFVHDGSGLAPTFMLEVSDAATAVDGPYLGNIVFNGGGGGGPGSGGAGGSGSGVWGTILLTPPEGPPIVPLSVQPDVLPHPLFPLVNPVAQKFVRIPTAPAEETRKEAESAPASTSAPPADISADPRQPQQPASGDASAQALNAAPGLPPVHAQAKSLVTAFTGSEVKVAPVRGEVDVVPTRRAAAVEGENQQRTDPVVTGIRVTGVVASISAVPWIAYATGLVVKLLASSPAWRGTHLLPVLGRDKEKKKRSATTRSRGRRRPAKRARRNSKR
jgi:hypothetical protein